MSRTLRRTVVVLGLVTAGVACQRHQSPTAPTAPTPGGHLLLTLRLDGPATLAPGTSAQLHAVKGYSDGTAEDVTTQAVWSSSDPSVISVGAAGLAKAIGRGAAQVTAAVGLSAMRSMLVLEDGTFPVSGRVLEDNLPVTGMTAAVTAGTGQGLGTLTDAKGEYTLYGVAGPVDLRYSKDGYTPVAQSLIVQGATRSPDVSVHQVTGPTNFSGQWRVTIARSASCATLPDDTASRSYDATVTQFGAHASMRLSSRDMWKGSPAVVTVHVTGAVLEITLSAVRDGYYSFYSPNLLYDVMETLDGQRFLGLRGVVSLDGSTIPMRGALNGSFDTFAGNSYYWSARPDKQCAAADHSVTMTR
ncbi:MAG TPA: hypothetical protein VF921_17665 [Vicinamibacterales bacterium]